jgi:3-dehydroquinate dehydratase-2
MLGLREPSLYGQESLEDINNSLEALAEQHQASCQIFQSNSEGGIVDFIQGCLVSNPKVDGMVLNLGAYTHTSIAIRDALLSVQIPFVEVHMSNVFAREPFRHHSMVSDIALGVISGFGSVSYRLGLQALIEHLEKN